MALGDRVLRCIDCGTEFVWSAGDPHGLADLRLPNEPKRCRACRRKRLARLAGASPWRVDTVATCSACGRVTTVPFRPLQGRPVFCRECFQHRRNSGARHA